MNGKENWSREWLDLAEGAEKDKQVPEKVC